MRVIVGLIRHNIKSNDPGGVFMLPEEDVK